MIVLHIAILWSGLLLWQWIMMFAGMERGFSWTYFPLSYTLLKFCFIIFYIQYLFRRQRFQCSLFKALSHVLFIWPRCRCVSQWNRPAPRFSLFISTNKYMNVGWNGSIADTVTMLRPGRPRNRGSIPVRGRNFSQRQTRSDHLWGRSSLVFSWYQGCFPGA